MVQIRIRENIVHNGKYISEVTFQNIVQYACQSGEFHWVNSFIKEYGNLLKNDIKKDCLSYCNGILFFHKKEYDRAIYLLSKGNWLKNYVIAARNLLIRSLYENFLIDNSNIFIIQNELQSFELFLLRSKLFTKSKLEGHLNLVRILKSLVIKVSNKVEASEIDDWLNKQFRKKDKIVTKNWLLGTVKSLYN